MSRVIIHISGPEHHKKTTIAAIIERILSDNGVKVHMPLDSQREQKMAKPLSELIAELSDSGVEIMLMESATRI